MLLIKKSTIGIALLLALLLGAGAAYGVFYAGENIDLLRSKIINLATPTADADAATKAYVDASFGVTFEGVTSATFQGPEVQGVFGGNQKCQSEFPGSRMCTVQDLLEAGNTTSATEGWVFSDSPEKTSCAHFTNKSLNIIDRGRQAWNTVSYTGTPSANFGVTAALRDDGTAIFTYMDGSDIWVFSCANAICNTGNATEVRTTADDGTSLTLGLDGFADIAVDDGANLEFIDCLNYDCSSFTNRVLSSNNAIWTSIQTSNGTGFPLIAYEVGNALWMYECTNAACTTGNDYLAYDSLQVDVPEMRIQANGNPVIVYHRNNNDRLDFLRCDNYNCTGGITRATPFFSEISVADQGRKAMTINDEGHVVVVAVESSTASLVQCGIEQCWTARETLLYTDSNNDFGLVIGPDGLPVVLGEPSGSTYSATKCLDRTCSEVETFSIDDSSEEGTGVFAFLQADGDIHAINMEGNNDNVRSFRIQFSSSYTGLTITEEGLLQSECEFDKGVACCS